MWSQILYIGPDFYIETEPNPQQTSSKLLGTLLERGSPPMKVGKCGFVITVEQEALLFKFANEKGRLVCVIAIKSN